MPSGASSVCPRVLVCSLKSEKENTMKSQASSARRSQKRRASASAECHRDEHWAAPEDINFGAVFYLTVLETHANVACLRCLRGNKIALDQVAVDFNLRFAAISPFYRYAIPAAPINAFHAI